MRDLFIIFGYFIVMYTLLLLHARRYGNRDVVTLAYASHAIRRRAVLRFFWSTVGLILLLSPVSYRFLWIAIAPAYFMLLGLAFTRLRPAWQKLGYAQVVLWVGIAAAFALAQPLGRLVRYVVATWFFSFR